MFDAADEAADPVDFLLRGHGLGFRPLVRGGHRGDPFAVAQQVEGMPPGPEAAVLAGDRSGKGHGRGWFPFAVLDGDTFAYLGLRPVPDSGPPLWEFGAFAYGPRGEQAAAAFATEIRKWDQNGRDLPPSAFGYWPADGSASIPSGTVIFPKAHGSATINWATRA